MFANPFTAVMALILLAFIGTLVIFFCIWREMDALRRSLQEVRSSMQFAALDMEQQNRDLAAVLRELRLLTGSAPSDLDDMLERGIANLEGAYTRDTNAPSGNADAVPINPFTHKPSSGYGPETFAEPGLDAAYGGEAPVGAYTGRYDTSRDMDPTAPDHYFTLPDDQDTPGPVVGHEPLRFGDSYPEQGPEPAVPYTGKKPGA